MDGLLEQFLTNTRDVSLSTFLFDKYFKGKEPIVEDKPNLFHWKKNRKKQGAKNRKKQGAKNTNIARKNKPRSEETIVIRIFIVMKKEDMKAIEEEHKAMEDANSMEEVNSMEENEENKSLTIEEEEDDLGREEERRREED